MAGTQGVEAPERFIDITKAKGGGKVSAADIVAGALLRHVFGKKHRNLIVCGSATGFNRLVVVIGPHPSNRRDEKD
jgi:hypothetical protein